MPENNETNTPSYADDIQRINLILEKLSQKDCDIDKMLDYVNEAAALLERCNQKLAKTGIQIDEALNKLNDMKLV